MKKTLKNICAAGMLLALAACSNDTTENPAPVPEEGQPVAMSFTATGDDATRTVLDGLKVYWQEGDAIGVYDASGDLAQFTTKDSGPTAVFEGKIAESSQYYAFYPYSSASSFGIKFEIPAEQPACANSFAPGLNFSFAKPTAERNFTFTNLCALVKFSRSNTSTRTITSVVLRGNKGEELSGIVKLLDPTSGNTTLSTVGTGNDHVTLKAADGASLETETDYYFVVRPQTLTDGLTLNFVADDGHIYSKHGARQAVLKAGTILDLGRIDPTDVANDIDYDEASNTYTIHTADGFRTFLQKVNQNLEANVILTADIDLGGETIAPIGFSNKATDYSGYKGTFDGQNHTISNFKIEPSDKLEKSAGFFMQLSGTVKNLSFKNVSVTSSDAEAGVIIGRNAYNRTPNAVIENCHVDGATVSGKEYAGAIAGYTFNCSITGCTATNCTVEGYDAVGGIVGLSLSPIEGCHFTGTVSNLGPGSDNKNGTGGIAGEATQTITGCSANATIVIESNKSKTGGIVGKAGDKVIGCAAAGSIELKGTALATGNTNVAGGLMGGSGTAIGSYTVISNIKAIDGKTGGFCGTKGGTYTACFTTYPGIDAVAGNPDLTADMQVTKITATQIEEMNAAIAQYGYEFTENSDSAAAGLPYKPKKK